ncbi:UbiX family flavin prenyltransferase [Mediterraneibacter glycyrrhizinilyticus]|nr:UbiX family flavin prenyltransferase [Mediterraneibacter glycyrrhizinilyticus]MBM6855857.1 UbiX family flavin prenyltransferase [Mediterraneibacter glycyrrhizinilyticus]
MAERTGEIKKKRIIVGAAGASGSPLLLSCLRLIREAEEYESWLVMSNSARLTMEEETGVPASEAEKLADHVLGPGEIGAGPASGSFQTAGMLIVPCSMKTVAGICSGYADNLILRAADVTIKEQRTLVLAARETPLSVIHLRNLNTLAGIPGVRIIPPMMTFYNHPETIEDMTYHIAAKLLEPFGIEAAEYKRWNGLAKGEWGRENILRYDGEKK